MKTIILLFGMIFIAHFAYAQRFSLNQLIKMNLMTFEQFHSYVTSKKYKLYELDDDKRTYAYGQTRTNLYATKVISKELNDKSDRKVIVFQTLTSGDYFSVQTHLDEQQYKLVNSKKSKGPTQIFTYRKDKTEVSLASDLYYNATGERLTFYQVKVVRL